MIPACEHLVWSRTTDVGEDMAMPEPSTYISVPLLVTLKPGETDKAPTLKTDA